MLAFPNAKINIGLNITSKRADGFHNLETVFFPIKWYDALEILPVAPGEKPSVHYSGLPIPGNPSGNLIRKAFLLLKNHFPKKIQEVTVYLHKCIPAGAGLGGGSADAAFMLKLLNDYFGLQLSQESLMALALELGSDCPFFVLNQACFAKGRGEILEPLPLDLSDYSIQVVCPGIHIPTARAFEKIVPAAPAFSLAGLCKLPVPDWKHYIYNDFEKSIFESYPLLAELKNELYIQGAVYASMSGTGSSIYGIFPKGKRAAIQLRMGNGLEFDEKYLA